MSKWEIIYHPKALADLRALDGSQVIQVKKAIKKVSQNPLPDSEGGLGKPLGNHNGLKLAGLLKIKLKKLGIRVVYRLIRTDDKMVILIIGMRSEEEVYEEAKNRMIK